MLVLGAPHSSNSVRMVEVAQEAGVPARLIESAAELDRAWLEGIEDLGLSSSASAPEPLVVDTLKRLRQLRPGLAVHTLGMPEDTVFKLPRALVDLRDMRQRPKLTRDPSSPDPTGAHL